MPSTFSNDVLHDSGRRADKLFLEFDNDDERRLADDGQRTTAIG